MADGKNYLISAAIDFGTTFSGYAFSTLNDYRLDPLKVIANNWGAGHFMSPKTSTCVLFDPSGNFSMFGYEAEEKYSELAAEKEHEEWYFFRRFKMNLYGEKKISRNMELKDECGKTMLAINVFSAGIKYLKDHMLETCMNQFSGLTARDIRWVLTVPAIWSDFAKQFMREAAEQAGITPNQLLIALEPEAASLYCRYLPMTKDSSGDLSVFKPGSQYLVLDAGGGTIDITVHQIEQDGTLREIHKVNGGDWGGTKVDDAFRNFLCQIVGNAAYDNFCYKDKYDLFDLFREFEIKKMSFNPESNSQIHIKIPSILNECCNSETGKSFSEQVSERPELSNNVTVIRDKFRVKPEKVREMFKDVTDHIVDHLIKLLRHPDAQNVTSILMVGGFSESKMLQEIIKSTFENSQVKVIVPQEPGLAVLKGAVINGHEPRSIKSRICKVTYGIEIYKYFDPDIHPASKREVTSDDIILCKDVFDILVREGDKVVVDEPHVTKSYCIRDSESTYITFSVWKSRQRNPKYVTDMCCEMLGYFQIDMPDTSRGLARKAKVDMIFGGTELEFKATDDFTGESVSASFDFLSM